MRAKRIAASSGMRVADLREALHDLLLAQKIVSLLRRYPSMRELKRSRPEFERLDESQYQRTCKELSFTFTPDKLLTKRNSCCFAKV